MVSNEVTVGPPLSGVNIPTKLPAKVDPEKYGELVALTNDENGDPALGFLWEDGMATATTATIPCISCTGIAPPILGRPRFGSPSLAIFPRRTSTPSR